MMKSETSATQKRTPIPSFVLPLVISTIMLSSVNAYPLEELKRLLTMAERFGDRIFPENLQQQQDYDIDYFASGYRPDELDEDNIDPEAVDTFSLKSILQRLLLFPYSPNKRGLPDAREPAMNRELLKRIQIAENKARLEEEYSPEESEYDSEDLLSGNRDRDGFMIEKYYEPDKIIYEPLDADHIDLQYPTEEIYILDEEELPNVELERQSPTLPGARFVIDKDRLMDPDDLLDELPTQETLNDEYESSGYDQDNDDLDEDNILLLQRGLDKRSHDLSAILNITALLLKPNGNNLQEVNTRLSSPQKKRIGSTPQARHIDSTGDHHRCNISNLQCTLTNYSTIIYKIRNSVRQLIKFINKTSNMMDEEVQALEGGCHGDQPNSDCIAVHQHKCVRELENEVNNLISTTWNLTMPEVQQTLFKLLCHMRLTHKHLNESMGHGVKHTALVWQIIKDVTFGIESILCYVRQYNYGRGFEGHRLEDFEIPKSECLTSNTPRLTKHLWDKDLITHLMNYMRKLSHTAHSTQWGL